jgi:hypothetical protein
VFLDKLPIYLPYKNHSFHLKQAELPYSITTMTDIFKNTRLEWLTKDLAEDYAIEQGGVNQRPVTTENQKKYDEEMATTRSELNVMWILGINIMCFPVNFMVTYMIGVQGYFLGLPTFEELSTVKYPTLLTPDHYWAFLVWHVIFAAQFIWVLLPMISSGKRDSAYLHMVERSYLTVTLAQVGYTLSFAYEIIWLSLIFIVVLLGSLLMIFQRIYSVEERTPRFKTYMQWSFPFTIHLGWVIPTTVYQLSVTFAYYGQEDFIGMFILGIFMFSMFFLAILFVNLNDFVVPSVIAGTFVSIYTKLENPQWEISERYTQEQIDGLKYSALGAAGLIVVWTVLCIWSLLVDWMLEEKDDEAMRQTEDNKAFDSASAYVPAQV